MIYDTDVLIWCLRGNERAARILDEGGPPSLSVVSYMELLQGARDRRELSLIRAFLKDRGFRTYPLSESVGHRAAVYMEEYAPKSSLSVADALIAATSVESNEPLCSGNAKHFKSIAELDLNPFRPS